MDINAQKLTLNVTENGEIVKEITGLTVTYNGVFFNDKNPEDYIIKTDGIKTTITPKEGIETRRIAREITKEEMKYSQRIADIENYILESAGVI